MIYRLSIAASLGFLIVACFGSSDGEVPHVEGSGTVTPDPRAAAIPSGDEARQVVGPEGASLEELAPESRSSREAAVQPTQTAEATGNEEPAESYAGMPFGDLSTVGLEELQELRRSLVAEMGKGMTVEGSPRSRVRTDLFAVERTILQRLREEAKTLSAAGPDKTRAALAAYTRVEDEATAMLDKWIRMRDEEPKTYLTTQFKEILSESNEYVQGAFTPEFIERTPWTDLLASDQEDDWQKYGLQGFRLLNGCLEVFGPAPGASANGLIAFPTTGGFRDFQMDMEFTLDGKADLLFRLGRRVDNTVEYCSLSTDDGEPLNPSQRYELHVSFIGDELRGAFTPEAASFPNLDSTWTKSRKGAIAAQIHEGTKFTITRLRIRVLRKA